ncbi:hypothetical protein LTR70_010669 [Exophiala xenobiotica]|nr:hypothetical protein LTR70_010669 [Exophiala xenobiotica]
MTKAALRRQERERQAQQGTDQVIPQQHETQQLSEPSTYGATEQPLANIPHMEPPPPYDAPHPPRGAQGIQDRNPNDEEHPGCLNFGPGTLKAPPVWPYLLTLSKAEQKAA